MSFKDHFSGRAGFYAAHRPGYPDELFEFVAGLPRARRRALDCATGSGQAARGLARRFEQVIALDASVAQIGHAVRDDAISYVVAKTEEPPIASASIDLIVAAQALHWLNAPLFFAEARRMLAPGGAIAIWGYGDPVLGEPGLDSILHRFNKETLGPWWPRERSVLLDEFRSIEFPMTDIVEERMQLAQSWTLEELAGNVRSWSGTDRMTQSAGDPVPALEEELREAWPRNAERVPITWPLFIRAGW